MQDLIAELRRRGDRAKFMHIVYKSPKPLADSAIRKLRLPTGEALPLELAEWLRYDASWFPLVKKGKDGPRLRAVRVRDLLTAWLKAMRSSRDEDVREELEELEEDLGHDDILGFWLDQLPEGVAELYAIELQLGTDQEALLILEPKQTSSRVLGCHKRLEFWWKYQSLAECLRHYFGMEDPDEGRKPKAKARTKVKPPAKPDESRKPKAKAKNAEVKPEAARRLPSHKGGEEVDWERFTVREGKDLVMSPCVDLVAMSYTPPALAGPGLLAFAKKVMQHIGSELRFYRYGDMKAYRAIDSKAIEGTLAWFSDTRVLSRKMLGFAAHAGQAARAPLFPRSNSL